MQSTTTRFFAVIFAFSIVGCALSLPSEQSVARRYEHDHPGCKVAGVTTTTTGVGQMRSAGFQITYTDAASNTRTDHIRYHRVAEPGWVHE